MVLPLLAALLMASGLFFGQATALPERYTALALPPRADASPGPVDIVIERWSTPAERDQIVAALKEAGTKGVVKVLQKFPRVGSFGAATALGHPAQYAWKDKTADGNERITILTDRTIAFWEVTGGSRSLDYPITYIELRIKPNGEGEGEAIVAARMRYDPFSKGIRLENFDYQPVRLNAVRRLK